jgi:GT2 family glycosyltransferase
MVVHVVYALLAPLSPDWRNWYEIGISMYEVPGQALGVYTVPPYLFAPFYALWLLLPIVHPNPASIVTFPPYGAPPYFQPTPSNLLFVLLMKLPALISDGVVAVLIWRLLLDSKVSKNRAYFAVGAWLFNPLTLLLGNFNDIETVPLMLVILAVILAGKRRFGFATVALIVAGLMRLLAFIALPFLAVAAIRRKDWRAVVVTTIPPIAILVAIYSWLALFRPDALALFQGRPGLYIPEALDVFGSALPLHGTEYPENAITLTTLAYVLALAIIARPSSNQDGRVPTLVSAPFLVYTAFSWVWPSNLIYGVVLAIIEIARGKGYKILTLMLSTVGLFWIVVQEGAYICSDGVSFLFIPLYNGALQALNTQCLSLYALLLSSGFSVPIRSIFSAVIVLLIIRMMVQSSFVYPTVVSGLTKPQAVTPSELPLVSVVIVSYNDAPIIEKLFDTLRIQDYPRFEVLVVDNAGNDSVRKLAQKYHARYIRSGSNLGYTGGNNFGVAQSRGEMILILNSDTRVSPDLISTLVSGFADHADRAMVVVPKVMIRDSSVINSIGMRRFHKYANLYANIGYLEGDRGQYDEPMRLDAFDGAAFMFRRELLKQTFLFNPFYFGGADSTDLAERVEKLGFEIWSCPGAIVRHELHATHVDDPFASKTVPISVRNNLAHTFTNLGIRPLMMTYLTLSHFILVRIRRGEFNTARLYAKGMLMFTVDFGHILSSTRAMSQTHAMSK